MTALQQPSQLLALHACIEAGALNVLGLPSCIQAVEELLCTKSIPCSSAVVSVSVDDSTASRMLASGTTCVFPSSLESMYFYHGGIDSVENCMHVLDTHLSICICHNGLEGTAEVFGPPCFLFSIMASSSYLRASRRKDLGLSFPGCGKGVTDPAQHTSIRKSTVTTQGTVR